MAPNSSSEELHIKVAVYPATPPVPTVSTIAGTNTSKQADIAQLISPILWRMPLLASEIFHTYNN
jgi:hypothetical protein